MLLVVSLTIFAVFSTMLPMSSRSERQKKLYRPVEPVIPSRQHIFKGPVIGQGSRLSGQVRTISPRTWKVVAIAIIVLLILFLTSPKPPIPPGQDVKGASSSLAPINLNTVRGSIPPVNPVQNGDFGKTLKDKLNLK